MLLRFTLSAAGALVLASTATAQLSVQGQPSPITSQVKDAGTYHIATGTWTRGITQVALAGPEVIYDNTCTVGFFFGMPDGTVMADSGRIPSTSSPATGSSLTGLYDAYTVNGFQIGYCTYESPTTNIDVGFTDMYAACDNNGLMPTPLVTFNLLNMPGGPGAGAQGCWIVTFDLANTTGEFGLAGDGNGNYDNVASTDSFAWTWTQTVPTTAADAGPIFAGDPQGFFPQSGQTCGGIGGGTTFAGASAAPGSGIGSTDQMELGGGGPIAPGCYWFGGYHQANANPFTAFWMKLDGEQGGNSGAAYCFGDGTGVACPCGNTGGTGEGCANSGGAGVTFTGSGVPSMGADSLQFDIAGVPGAKFGLILRGDNQISTPVGDGIICAAGLGQRSQIQQTSAAGTTTFTNWNGAGFGSVSNLNATTNFQFWYRDPQGPCSTTFNFSNAWSVTYLP